MKRNVLNSVLIAFVLVFSYAASAQAVTQKVDTELPLRQNRPLRHWIIILRTDIHYGGFFMVDGGGDCGYVSWDAALKFPLSFDWPVEPYIEAAITSNRGVGASLNAVVEKAFVFNSGISLTPSIGIDIGICGLPLGVAPIVGSHSFFEFAFGTKRFRPFLRTGVKYLHVFGGSWCDLSFPLGAGLSLKI